MGPDPHILREPRERLADYLRRQYGGLHPAKRCAVDLDCAPRTAENILSGHWPGSKHWAAIVRRFGADVLDAVFGPEIDATVARLQQQVTELEQRLALTRADLGAASGSLARGQGGNPSAEER